MIDREPDRLRALKGTHLLDSPPERAFDRLARLAADLLHAPTALVSLVDERRQFFKSAVGLGEPWTSLREAPLTHSFCQQVTKNREPVVIGDSREHPALTHDASLSELNVIAYVGVPLYVAGEAIGSFCVIDSKPREWSEEQLRVLTDLAESVVSEIELRLARSALEKTAHELQEASTTDSLTGLLNRRGFSLIAEQAIRAASRSGLSLALFFVDLNGMKGINDTHGHRAGDEALVETAALLRRVFRASDVVGRLGGDEFVVLATGAPRESEEAVSKRMRAELDERNIASVKYRLSVSIGMSVYDPNAPVSLDQMLSDADARTYVQKQARHSRASDLKKRRGI